MYLEYELAHIRRPVGHLLEAVEVVAGQHEEPLLVMDRWIYWLVDDRLDT